LILWIISKSVHAVQDNSATCLRVGQGRPQHRTLRLKSQLASAMFAVSDSRISNFSVGTNIRTIQGMWQWWPESNVPKWKLPRHGKGYNVVLCDGHVEFIKRADYLNLRKTARNFNNDYEPHPETWQNP
jgi:prepilin-type processing-associated H-X9-DG protein